MFSDINLWNDLGFSLYAVLSICYVITILNEQMKSKMEVSADLVYYCWILEIKFNKINYQTNELQCNY